MNIISWAVFSIRCLRRWWGRVDVAQLCSHGVLLSELRVTSKDNHQ